MDLKFGPEFCLATNYFTESSLNLFALFNSVNMAACIATIGHWWLVGKMFNGHFCTENVFHFFFQK